MIKIGTTNIKSAKYGDVPGPTLKIVDWIDRPQLALADASMKTVVEEQAEPEKPSSHDDLNDEIPF